MRAAAVLAAALAACALAVPAARADGDPASDTLIGGQVFFPYYVKLPPASKAELTRVLAEAKKQGYPVRVALIAHDFDMGAVTPLFRKPQPYAKFLAQELANYNTDWVLAVMPDGYGIYHCTPKKRPGGYSDPCEGGRPTAADQRLLAAVAVPAKSGQDVAATATVAVRKLAALHGVEIADATGGGGAPWALLGGGAAVVLLVAAGLGFWLLRRRRS